MFPSFEKWCDTVLHPEDTHPWNFRTLEFYNEYKAKYTLAKMIQPGSILEIGVRFGYGAFSFLLANPKALYTGLDFDEPSWGLFKGVPRKYAQTYLSQTFPHSDVRTYAFDTQKDDPTLFFAPLENYVHDLVHIDGDHSYEGAKHDLKTFWPFCCKAMIVDDYTDIGEVSCAVEDFMAEHPEALMISSASLRGSAVIVRDE